MSDMCDSSLILVMEKFLCTGDFRNEIQNLSVKGLVENNTIEN